MRINNREQENKNLWTLHNYHKCDSLHLSTVLTLLWQEIPYGRPKNLRCLSLLVLFRCTLQLLLWRKRVILSRLFFKTLFRFFFDYQDYFLWKKLLSPVNHHKKCSEIRCRGGWNGVSTFINSLNVFKQNET